MRKQLKLVLFHCVALIRFYFIEATEWSYGTVIKLRVLSPRERGGTTLVTTNFRRLHLAK